MKSKRKKPLKTVKLAKSLAKKGTLSLSDIKKAIKKVVVEKVLSEEKKQDL